MEFLQITQDDPAAVARLSRVATEIVREYYDPLLGTAQNDYMLERFQSLPAISAQLAAGYSYYLAADDGRTLGFFGFYPRGEVLYLSKFYLYAQHRGKGHARQILDFLITQAAGLGLHAIELNVNKHNPSIAVYEHLGFVRVRAECNDIGGGFFMDDYVYRLSL